MIHSHRGSAPVAHFESFGRETPGWSASFRTPVFERSADTIDRVVPLLREAEEAAKAGSWVAVALSYDAAPALDDALQARPAQGFPLAWIGVFDQPSSEVAPSGDRPFLVSDWEPQITKRAYSQAIKAIKGLIEEGDAYQVNFTFPLRGYVAGDSFSCFRQIAQRQGAAYSAYLDIGSHRILSFSPELFLERRGKSLITRPMKGTLARGRWLEEDRQRVEQLKASEKDRAENVMIVDLMRSDLGKVAEIGTVDVPELFQVERLARALQMTSTIKAVQRPGTGLVDLMRALFPCGSVTGAPKARTTAIIKDLETKPRGLYTGAIGLIAPGGDAVFNVAIRTLVVDSESGCAGFGVGGAITWDSTIDGEYEECRLKARFLTHPWPDFSLLETLALEDGVYKLLDRHLSRARNSACYFGFRWNEAEVLEALDDVKCSHPSGLWRVRAIIGRNGEVSAESSPLEIRTTPLTVKFAACPVDDRDPLLFHKITDRSRYEADLERCRPCDDVILWNNRGEVTESTVANVVVFSDGKNWTPPREAGLLGGTLREELIASGELHERIITKQELEAVRSFALINSVRGWMEARLPATSCPPG